MNKNDDDAEDSDDESEERGDDETGESDDETEQPARPAEEERPGYEAMVNAIAHHAQPTEDEDDSEALVEGIIVQAIEAAVLVEPGYGVEDSNDEELDPLAEEGIRDSEDFEEILAIRNILTEEVSFPARSPVRKHSDSVIADQKCTSSA